METERGPSLSDSGDTCPPALVARFGVTRLLGRGGMGAVYRARLPELGKPCALKVVQGKIDRNARERLMREAVAMSRVRHPNLIEVYDCGDEAGTPWIAMEVVDGETVAARRSRAPFSPEELAALVRDVAGALEVLHAAGIQHRDLKPSNLMLDEQGRVVVMDLGLARDVDRTRITATGAVVGTLAYMAPEILLEEATDFASDWYALGATLHELLAGELPFSRDEVMTMAGTRRWRQPRPPAGPAGTEALAELAGELMRVDPRERPASLAEIEVILAAPPRRDAAPRPPRAPGTRPPRVAGRRVAAVLAIVAAGVAGFLATRAPREDPGRPGRVLRPSGEVTLLPVPENPTPRILAAELGFGDEADPVLVLAELLRHERFGMRDQVLAALPRLDPSPARRYLEVEARMATGEGPPGEEPELGPAATYLDARAAIRVRAWRIRVEEDVPKRMALAGGAAGLDRRFEELGRAWGPIARAELFLALADVAYHKGRFVLPALEEARARAAAVARGYLELPAELRFPVARILLRTAVGLRDPWLHEAVLAVLPGAAEGPFRDAQLVKDWQARMGLELPAAVLAEGRAFLPNDAAPGRQATPKTAGISFPAGTPGAGVPPGGLPVVRLASRAPMDFPGEARTGEDLQAALHLAYLLAAPLRVDGAWATEVAAPALRDEPEGALARVLRRSPEVVLAALPALGERAGAAILRRVWGEISTSGHRTERRCWFRGAWARLAATLFRRRLEDGQPGAAVDILRRFLQRASTGGAPWTLEELGLAATLWAELAAWGEGARWTRGVRAEAIRIGLRALEAAVELRASDTSLYRELRALIAPLLEPPASAEGPRLPADVPPGGKFLPEDAFPPSSGDAAARFARLP